MTHRDTPPSVLVIGASYGLLPAAKIAAVGFRVTVVGVADEVGQITRDGVEIRFGAGRTLTPPMGANGLSASTPNAVTPEAHDLVILAVQEPQAGALAPLLDHLSATHPIVSIMNMPPPPFLERDPALQTLLRPDAYCSMGVWSSMQGCRMTMAAPDPQAYRPDPDRPGVLRVTLASNFKFAPFEAASDQALLGQVARAASRVRAPWGKVPVNLITRKSLYTPLSKWPMLVTGNCRSVGPDRATPLSIHQAVNDNSGQSQVLYDGINAALRDLGAPSEALVPFARYAAAAQQLVRPSSLAMALARGATEVERIDLLVSRLLQFANADSKVIDLMNGISDRIAAHLETNRNTAIPRLRP